MASRIDALLAAARDVGPAERLPFRPAVESDEHRARFQQYVRQLRSAKRVADDWWASLIATEAERIGEEEHAAVNVRLRRPPGPVVNPAVIHVIRSAWLDCQSINERSPAEARVAPEAFVLLWLQEAGRKDLADFVAGLPFWPLGLDDNGRWI
jgi:hypothetical protein